MIQIGQSQVMLQLQWLQVMESISGPIVPLTIYHQQVTDLNNDDKVT